MPNINNESLPLLNQPDQTTPLSFFQKLSAYPLQTIKTTGQLTAGALSGYMYWPSSFQAAAFAGKALQYIAALGGSTTNAIFNIESFLSFSHLPPFRKIPFRYAAAFFFATCCTAPNFFMNIINEEGDYIDNSEITIQGLAAFLNIWVNIVGSLSLIDTIFFLTKSRLVKDKERFMEKINKAITTLTRLKTEEQTEENLINFFNLDLTPTTLSQKGLYHFLGISLGILSMPQFAAYVVISYFGMKDLSKKKWAGSETISILLGLIAAIGNAIPSAGFSIKGLLSTRSRITRLENPSLLTLCCLLPAIFSGFTAHKAMADSLKQLAYTGRFTVLLNWSANLGVALIYNLPQMLALADRFEKNTSALPSTIKDLPQQLKDQLASMDTNEFYQFRHNAINHGSHRFFQRIRHNHETLELPCQQPLSDNTTAIGPYDSQTLPIYHRN